MNLETYEHWKSLNAQLKLIKKDESALRKQLVAEYKGADADDIGTFNVVIHGDEVKIVQRDTLKLDAAILKTMWQELTEDEKACIEHAPKLMRKEYEALPLANTLSMEIVARSLSLPAVTVVS